MRVIIELIAVGFCIASFLIAIIAGFIMIWAMSSEDYWNDPFYFEKRKKW